MGAVLPSSAVGPEVIFLLLEENCQRRVLQLIAFSMKKPFDRSKKIKFLVLPSMLLTPFCPPTRVYCVRFSVALPGKSHERLYRRARSESLTREMSKEWRQAPPGIGSSRRKKTKGMLQLGKRGKVAM